MASAATATPPAATTASASSTLDKAKSSILFFVTNPWTWTFGSVFAFLVTFGITLSSGVNLNGMDKYNLRVWWAGTILSSALFLLLFYVVFASTQYFNKSLIVLLFTTLILTHVSLLLTQLNLKVK